MNQFNSQKIEQKRCMCQADFTFSQLNIHYKRFKFDLALNKSVRLQSQEEVKDIILKSLCFNRNIKNTLIYHMYSSATVFFKYWRKNNPFAN